MNTETLDAAFLAGKKIECKRKDSETAQWGEAKPLVVWVDVQDYEWRVVDDAT